jgi:hypothetical protein
MEVWKVVLPTGDLEEKRWDQNLQFVLKCEERYKLSKVWSDLFSSKSFG